MTSTTTINPSTVGPWFDNHHGIYIGEMVQSEAVAYGWDGEYLSADAECYADAWVEAEDYLSSLAPEGYWFGQNENGDAGLWHICNPDDPDDLPEHCEICDY